MSQRLRQYLARHRRVGIDTSPFIYHAERHPTYAPLSITLFAWIGRGRSLGVTSTLTMTEALALPFRQGRQESADRMFSALLQMPNIEWLAPSLGVAERAARARAGYGLRTLDAIQLATTLTAGATGFVTNDQHFRRVTDVEVLMLDDFLA